MGKIFALKNIYMWKDYPLRASIASYVQSRNQGKLWRGLYCKSVLQCCLSFTVKHSYLWLRHPVDTKVICKNCQPRETWIQDDRTFDQILWINMTPDIVQRKLINRDENSLSLGSLRGRISWPKLFMVWKEVPYLLSCDERFQSMHLGASQTAMNY